MAGGGHIKNGRIFSWPSRRPRRCSSRSNWSRRIPAAIAPGQAGTTRFIISPKGSRRLARFDFPVRLFDVTRASFERTAQSISGTARGGPESDRAEPEGCRDCRPGLSEMPAWNAQLRTTCVATMLSGGHAENALPQTASAVVNCRLLPGRQSG